MTEQAQEYHMDDRIWIEDIAAGDVVTFGRLIDYEDDGNLEVNIDGTCSFVGWKIVRDEQTGTHNPVATFEDVIHGMEWTAYLCNGRFCVGSSAYELALWKA